MSDTVYADIRSALRSALLTVPNLPEVKWEGREYTPTVGTPYLRESLNFGRADLRSLPAAGGKMRLNGLWFLDLFFPPREGTGPAVALVAAIRVAVPHGGSVLYGTQRVHFLGFSAAKAIESNDWYHVPCTLGWRADFTNAAL